MKNTSVYVKIPALEKMWLLKSAQLETSMWAKPQSGLYGFDQD